MVGPGEWAGDASTRVEQTLAAPDSLAVDDRREIEPAIAGGVERCVEFFGALGTAIVYAPGLGGPGDGSVSIGAQLGIQAAAVGATVVWAAIGTAIAIYAAKAVTGLRVSPEVEREGLDLGEHGERAYNY